MNYNDIVNMERRGKPWPHATQPDRIHLSVRKPGGKWQRAWVRLTTELGQQLSEEL